MQAWGGSWDRVTKPSYVSSQVSQCSSFWPRNRIYLLGFPMGPLYFAGCSTFGWVKTGASCLRPLSPGVGRSSDFSRVTGEEAVEKYRVINSWRRARIQRSCDSKSKHFKDKQNRNQSTFRVLRASRIQNAFRALKAGEQAKQNI